MAWHHRAGGRTAALLFLVAALLPEGIQGYFRGDPVQMFKRIQYESKRTVWSDVLVGQAPIFAVDRAIELHVPTEHIPRWEALKLQMSYDNERFTSEWITLGDGSKHVIDLIHVVFVYSGSDIHEVRHKLTYRSIDASGDSYDARHDDKVTVSYHWLEEKETDTRTGLNFLFVAGCFLTALALVAVALDSGALAQDRALLVPEYDEKAGARPSVKSFVLFESEGGGDREVQADAEAGGRERDALQDGMRARGGAGAGAGGAGEMEGEAGARAVDKEGGKAD